MVSEVSNVLTTVSGDINQVIGMVVPVALGIFTTIFGFSLLPRLIKRFGK